MRDFFKTKPGIMVAVFLIGVVVLTIANAVAQ